MIYYVVEKNQVQTRRNNHKIKVSKFAEFECIIIKYIKYIFKIIIIVAFFDNNKMYMVLYIYFHSVVYHGTTIYIHGINNI